MKISLIEIAVVIVILALAFFLIAGSICMIQKINHITTFELVVEDRFRALEQRLKVLEAEPETIRLPVFYDENEKGMDTMIEGVE